MKLTTSRERGDYIAALSIGALLHVVATPDGMHAADLDAEFGVGPYQAEVIEKIEGQSDGAARSVVQIELPDVVGGFVAELWHSDGESLKIDPDPRRNGWTHGCYFSVAVDPEIHTEPPEVEGVIVEEPKAVARTDIPHGAAWLLEQATVLDAEAKKYKDYSTVHSLLTNASSYLRSAVGHVLAGGQEKNTATTGPF